MAKHLSEFTKGQICALRAEGLTLRKIAQLFNVTHKTIMKITKKFEQTGTTARKSGSGRIKKLTERNVRALKRICKQNRKLSSRQVAQEFQLQSTLSVSHVTVIKKLKNIGVTKRKPFKKPRLTKKHKQARISFCRQFMHYTEDQWQKVLFSDEKKFLVYGNDAGIKLWMEDSEKLHDECVIPTEKFNEGVMFWGCFSARGVGRVLPVEGNLNSQGYIDLLESRLLPTIQDQFAHNKQSVQFIQDNASCHKSRIVMNWLRNNGIETLDFPPKSADLNPIENLWHIVQQKMLKKVFTNKKELISAFLKVWHSEIPIEMCQNLANSMPHRIMAVIKAKGASTKY